MTIKNRDTGLTKNMDQHIIESNISTNILLLLLDLIEEVTQSSKFDELLDRIGIASHKLLNVEASSMMLLDDSGKFLTVIMATGPVKEQIRNKKIPADKGYAGWVINNQKPIIANHIHEESDIFFGELSEEFETCNLICVPLFDDKKNIMGVLEAINRKDGTHFNEEEIPVFQALANHSARTIQRVGSKEKLSKLLQEREVFLKEIHHRVKNDFALISGIVQMGKFEVENEDAQHVLDSVQARIRAMASVHELLASKDADAKINAANYFDKLVNKISTNFSNNRQHIKAKIEAEEFYLDSRTALSCGLIINELMMNSYKHAFEQVNNNTVFVQFTEKEDAVSLTYYDNGKGLPDGFDIEQQSSMGFKIISALVNQLNGSLRIENKKRTEYIIQFPS